MSHIRGCNILNSLPPLALLIKYKFEWIRHTREASKIENNLSPHCCRSIYATAQLYLYPLPITAVVTKPYFSDFQWGSLTHHPTKPTVGLNGSLLPFPIQSTSHSAHRAFFSIQSHSVICLSLHPVDHFQQRLWTSSKGKYLHNCCPCLGSQLISCILTSEPFKMPGIYPTVSGTGWDRKSIESESPG